MVESNIIFFSLINNLVLVSMRYEESVGFVRKLHLKVDFVSENYTSLNCGISFNHIGQEVILVKLSVHFHVLLCSEIFISKIASRKI